jgi:hypothetical protein
MRSVIIKELEHNKRKLEDFAQQLRDHGDSLARDLWLTLDIQLDDCVKSRECVRFIEDSGILDILTTEDDEYELEAVIGLCDDYGRTLTERIVSLASSVEVNPLKAALENRATHAAFLIINNVKAIARNRLVIIRHRRYFNDD